jgi:hypothetical protein
VRSCAHPAVTLDLMSFGQPSGPPATARQLRELIELLEQAGHSDFRDARGPMGFTQRQAAGKFSRDEADAFIEQLQAAAELDDAPAAVATPAAAIAPKRPTAAERAVRDASDELLAAELQRRGWIVVAP